jgi:type II secretory pathway component HofQ
MGGADVFEEAFRTYGKDPEALRFLLQAVGSALPGRERWEEVWNQVVVDVDRRIPGRPRVRVTWPGLPVGLCPCSGTRVVLHFQDSQLFDVFRVFSDISRLNVVVNPGVKNESVTYRASQVPWDEALEQVLAPNGLVAEVRNNVLRIGRPSDVAPAREAGQTKTFTGAPISFDLEKMDLVEALREIAAHGRASVEVAEGVMGKVTLKLNDVPWDQAFDLVVRTNGLTWTRTGDVIRVEPPRRAPSP